MLSGLCCRFGLLFCSVCLASDSHLKLLDRAVSDARFLTGGVFECDIAHRRYVAVLCMLYYITCNPMHLLNGALPGPSVPVRLHGVPWSHIGILMPRLATEPCRETVLLFLCQCPSETILLTPCLMVWNWWVSRAGPLFFIGPSCYFPTIVFHYFFL